LELVFFNDHRLSDKARELVDFDIASIRQAAMGRHARAPALWLADPDGYEQDGRVLRDSPSPRLLAFSPEDRILYANDGCNSCIHALSIDLGTAGAEELSTVAVHNKIEPRLVKRMAELAAAL
jgi:hypothetical protein